MFFIHSPSMMANSSIINEKCFHNYNNHKTIEMLCCGSKNVKINTVFQSYKDFLIFLHTSHMCCNSCEEVSTQVLWYLSQHFFLTHSLVYMAEPVFLPFLNGSSAQKWKKTNIYRSEHTAGKEHYVMVLQSYKTVYYFS